MDMQLTAWAAASLVFCSFFMKTIIPLRSLAIASNLLFISYALLGWYHGIFDKVLPILVLHLALLPLNILRLHQARATTHEVRRLKSDSAPDYLIPYTTEKSFPAGTVFSKPQYPSTFQ